MGPQQQVHEYLCEQLGGCAPSLVRSLCNESIGLVDRSCLSTLCRFGDRPGCFQSGIGDLQRSPPFREFGRHCGVQSRLAGPGCPHPPRGLQVRARTSDRGKRCIFQMVARAPVALPVSSWSWPLGVGGYSIRHTGTDRLRQRKQPARRGEHFQRVCLLAAGRVGRGYCQIAGEPQQCPDPATVGAAGCVVTVRGQHLGRHLLRRDVGAAG